MNKTKNHDGARGDGLLLVRDATGCWLLRHAGGDGLMQRAGGDGLLWREGGDGLLLHAGCRVESKGICGLGLGETEN